MHLSPVGIYFRLQVLSPFAITNISRAKISSLAKLFDGLEKAIFYTA